MTQPHFQGGGLGERSPEGGGGLPHPQSLRELDLDPLTLPPGERRIPRPGGRSGVGAAGGSPLGSAGSAAAAAAAAVADPVAHGAPVRSPALALPLFLLLHESETGGTKVKPKLLLLAQPGEGRGTGAAAGQPTWQAQDGGRSRFLNCGDLKKRSLPETPPPPPPRPGLLRSPLSPAGVGGTGPGPAGEADPRGPSLRLPLLSSFGPIVQMES